MCKLYIICTYPGYTRYSFFARKKENEREIFFSEIETNHAHYV